MSPDTGRVKVKVGDEILSARLGDSIYTNAEAFFLNAVPGARVSGSYQLSVLREGKQVEVSGTLVPEARYDVFREMAEVTPAQLELRRKWTGKGQAEKKHLAIPPANLPCCFPA